MVALVFLKIIATSFTIGSGGSGGVFAPGLFIGGMLGGAIWGMLHGRVGWLPPTPAPFVIVGMMALFGGVAKAPLAVMLMVAEMTGEFSMIVPAMIATGVAYLLTGNITIYESQVATRADSPAHRASYRFPLIQEINVDSAMRRTVETIAGRSTVAEAELRMEEAGVRGLPVIEAGRIVGMITASDTARAMRQGQELVTDAMTQDVLVATPDENLHDVLQRMTGARISRLPVVDASDRSRMIGIISVRDIARALDREIALLAEVRLNSAV
jgi:CIC family chloride channel protein